MSEISTKLIEKAVYTLCYEANTRLNNDIYNKIYDAYKSSNNGCKEILKTILQNAQISYEKKLPLCQDTGQVLVFIKIGQEIKLTGDFLEDAVNNAVKKCYKENYFRKSTVKNSVFDRSNTNDNTPAIINIKYIKGDEMEIGVLIKGAGSENKSRLKMMLPNSSEEEIITQCAQMILDSKDNACPPMFIGIGMGADSDRAMLLSKEAFLEEDFSEEEKNLAQKIKEYVNSKADSKYQKNYVLDVKIKTAPTHIASLPIGITVNCHSDRTAKCRIKNGEIKYNTEPCQFKDIEPSEENIKEIKTDEIEILRSLSEGEKILLTGEIYVARDMAHKRMSEMILKGEELPFNPKNKIILYAGPCPAKPNEIIGSIGPTTSSRMDKYAPDLYKLGLLATIGKGTRSKETEEIIKQYNGKYFTITGGIAGLLSQKVKKCEVTAFKDLGPEALYKIVTDKLPLETKI